MKKKLKILLQKIIRHRQQNKQNKISLITKYKNHFGDKNADNSENNLPLCLCTNGFNNNRSYSAVNEVKPKKQIEKSEYNDSRKYVYEWISSYKPTHFLTIQFPKNMRSSSLDISKDNLRRLMARFEQSLIGSRWTQSHLPFFCFAEKGRKDIYNYHFHILFNSALYDTQKIKSALKKACNQLALSSETCYLEKIKTYKTIDYCLKKTLPTTKNGCFDTIMHSSYLFNL